jgi:8-oxo-dGTP pyrophosphatase MutT (NUDIX family)
MAAVADATAAISALRLETPTPAAMLPAMTVQAAASATEREREIRELHSAESVAPTRDERLLVELQAYVAADDTEERHRLAMVALLEKRAEAFSRAHFAPGHFTASCYIVDGSGLLLLHHHRRLNRWLQMGGHVEGDELPALTALREGSEESGLRDLVLIGDAIFDLDIHGIPAAKGEPDHDHYDVRYVARTASPHAIAIDRAESNDLAWVTLGRAAELMPGSESQRVLRKIERLLRERSLN